MNWIPIIEKYPENNIPVLAGVVGSHRSLIIRVVWIPKFTRIDAGDYNGDCDYLEETDEYYWPEGWYEWNYFEETHWKVSLKITHWMPLPELPID